MQRLSHYTLGLLTALSLVGCGDDKPADTTESAGTTEQATTEVGTTATPTMGGEETSTTEPVDPTGGGDTSTGEPAGETAADGEPCVANGDCMSLACVKFSDLDPDATCEAGPSGNVTRFTGTIFDFVTKLPVPMSELRVLGALSALQDPMSPNAIVTATSDAMGRIDATSMMPIKEGIGVVGLVGGGASPYYITATGLAAPLKGTSYGPLNAIHDIWAVPTASLTAWSTALMTDPDPAVAMELPLGDKGGVIGLVRDGSGAGVAGAVVKSTKDTSSVLIRYLNDDMLAFNADMTGTSGIFVVMNPSLGELFTVDVGGAPTELTGTAGSSEGAAFVLIFNVP